MIPKPLNSVESSDLHALVSQQTAESRTLEFKRELVGPKDEDKREFLADISAFANTVGGDLIFGIDQIDGIAGAVSPLTISNIDTEQQRLEAIIRSGLEPRMPQYEFKWIGLESDKYVLIIRVGRSWSAPHRVIFRDHSKFYARSSTGKYLYFPELFCEDALPNAHMTLKPLCDLFWQAFGYERSFDFDEQGQYVGR